MSIQVVRDIVDKKGYDVRELETGTFFVTKDGDPEDALLFLKLEHTAIATGEDFERNLDAWGPVYKVSVRIVVKE